MVILLSQPRYIIMCIMCALTTNSILMFQSGSTILNEARNPEIINMLKSKLGHQLVRGSEEERPQCGHNVILPLIAGEVCERR